MLTKFPISISINLLILTRQGGIIPAFIVYNMTTPKHYNFYYKDIKIDPYRILLTYNITRPAQQHAIKKLLRAGQSEKEYIKDIKEVIVALNREIEMLNEDLMIEGLK